jgi:hypothetical protein
VFLLLAIVVRHDDVHWERAAAWGFVALLVVALGCYGAFTVWAERTMRRAGVTSRTSDPAA